MDISSDRLRRLYEQKAAQCRHLAVSAGPYSLRALETLAADFDEKAAALGWHPADGPPRDAFVFRAENVAPYAVRCPGCGIAVAAELLAAATICRCRLCGRVVAVRAEAGERTRPAAAPRDAIDRTSDIYETRSDAQLAEMFGRHEIWLETAGQDGKRAILVQCDLSHRSLDRPRLPMAVLSGARLRSAHLDGAGLALCDFGGADLQQASLAAADLRGANLQDAVLDEADLSAARFNPITNVGGHGTNLPARLGRAKLRGANLQGADFRFADLAEVDFEGANLKNADFRHARLSGMNVAGARLDGVRW